MNDIVNGAVQRIISSDQPDPSDIIRIAMWIRFSRSLSVYRSACVAASAFYIEHIYKGKYNTISNNSEFYRCVADIIDTSELLCIHKNQVKTISLEMIEYGSQPGFNEIREVSDCLHFILWYKRDSKLNVEGANLNRAYWYISNYGFVGRSPNTWRTFLTLWGYNRNAANFIYAAERLVDDAWVLDPMEPSFADSIQKLCDRSKVIRLLSEAKAVERELDGKLHPRSRAGMAHATIPSDVVPAVLDAVALPRHVYDAMEKYEPETSPGEDLGSYRPGRKY